MLIKGVLSFLKEDVIEVEVPIEALPNMFQVELETVTRYWLISQEN